MVSIQGNTGAQIFINSNFTTVHPKSRVAQAFTKFTDNVGIPDMLLSDGAAEVTGQHADFMKEEKTLKIRLRRSEAGRPIRIMLPNRNSASLRAKFPLNCGTMA